MRCKRKHSYLHGQNDANRLPVSVVINSCAIRVEPGRSLPHTSFESAICLYADVTLPKVSVAKKLLEAIADEERLYFNEELRRPAKLSVIST